MLDRLVASHPDRTGAGTWISGLLAALMHGGLVTAAVVATLPAPRAPAPRFIRLGDAPYYVPRARAGDGGAAPLPRSWAAPNLDGLRLPVPDPGDLSLPPGIVDLGVPRSTVGSWGTGGPTSVPGPGGGGAGRAPDGVYRSLAVDEPPVLLTRLVLDYPALLGSAGIEGLVVIEVIVDSTGVPEPGSLRVVEASHAGFVAAATRVVLGARFRPGRVQGHAVRVLIRQPIAFRLAR